MENINFEATIKEVSIRNLVSLDKGVRITLQTQNIREAMRVAEVPPDKLIKISTEKITCYASVVSVKKENLKDKEDRAEINLESASAEATNAVLLSMLPPTGKVAISFNYR
jgi:uncharacterized protein related to proFAR isomerase